MKTLAADNFHPVSIFLYTASLIIISMTFFNPLFIAASAVISVILSLFAVGIKKTLKAALITLPISAVIAVFNPIISHGGRTLLFYLFDTPITFEALFYGICSGTMLFSVIMFFSVYNRLVPPDKFLFIFSKAAPAFSMVVMMTQRFIPLFNARFKAISSAKKTLGEKGGLKSALNKNSMLLLWSMEEGLETADSMKARGYGTSKRSSFSLYRFSFKDVTLTVLTALFIVISIVFYSLSKKAEFYPIIQFDSSLYSLISLLCFIILGTLFPINETLFLLKTYFTLKRIKK